LTQLAPIHRIVAILRQLFQSSVDPPALRRRSASLSPVAPSLVPQMSDFSPLEFLKLAIFYASYLFLPAAAFLVWVARKRSHPSKIVAAILFVPLALFGYARFIEPRILLTVEHEARLERCFPQAGSARVAVFSDTHEGLFGNAIPIERIARRVERTDADAVLIAGDFVYFLAPERFERTFAALGGISAPVVGVLGNHDVGLPGPDVGRPLTKALEKSHVLVLDNEIALLRLNGADVEIAGLSDLWQDRQDRKLLENRGPVPRIVLTHNPHTILELLPRQSVDVLFAGHTHGGQINIPGFTCVIFRSMCLVARYGLAETDRGLAFVTSGTGMVGLPMRFNAAPRIDVVRVSWRACG
jgi:hypothetical protein